MRDHRTAQRASVQPPYLGVPDVEGCVLGPGDDEARPGGVPQAAHDPP